MTSPVVWQDAFDRAKTAGAALGLTVLDALEQQRTTPDGPFVLFEVASASADRFGVGEIVDEETGQIWLHLMVESGSGALSAITLRKVLSVAFRVPVSPLPEGLYYDGQGFDPPDADDKGNWFRFSLMVDYRYQDRVLTTP
ncbi:hypothetical protein JRX38_02545 [Gluconobacter cerinus]|uniref:hypothetical protein n=1 Tax=Gluconobacter cerinus TaxID=38307 RepID=UPI00193FD173|nr:hypothetical protein [Gluconobacter cerinus]MBM3096910.1 hypothetical protein [Gluconobacter cerinus]